jgi:hypothetical protein
LAASLAFQITGAMSAIDAQRKLAGCRCGY